MTDHTHSTLFGRIGRALRQAARIYVGARMMQARWQVLSQLGPERLQNVNSDHFVETFIDANAISAPPVSANDDQQTRRAA